MKPSDESLSPATDPASIEVVAGVTPAKAMNVRDVAKHAKVSVATVSMVLNDNPRISRATHLHVRRTMEQIGFRPNRLAQSLSSRYTQVLAVMLPTLRHAFADAYFGELISGICDRAGKLGYKVMLEQAKPDFIKEKKHIDIFERRFVDGVLCLGCNDRHAFLKDYAAKQYYAVVVDNYLPQLPLDFVACDYRSGAEQAMNCLLQLGHRKVAMIYAAPEVRTAQDLMDVYQARMAAAGAAVGKSWMEDGRFTEEGGAAAAEQLLARHPDLTAVFAANDKMALGALNTLARHGVRVPADVSLVGFDDLRHSAFVTPSLTTVHLPLYEVGSLACARLIERVHGKPERVAERIPTHLVLRDSTAMVPIRT